MLCTYCCAVSLPEWYCHCREIPTHTLSLLSTGSFEVMLQDAPSPSEMNVADDAAIERVLSMKFEIQLIRISKSVVI